MDDPQRSRMSTILNDQTSMRKDVIDEHLFVEALALTAFEIQYQEPQPSNSEKVSRKRQSLFLEVLFS